MSEVKKNFFQADVEVIVFLTITALQKAFSMNDGSLSREALAYSCNILGLSYLEKNQTEKAVQYFNKALELQPDFKEMSENLKKTKGEK